MSVDKWEQRMLCPDGACVGVISMNGTCKVCGTAVPDWGDPRKPGRVSSKAEADEPAPDVDEEEDDDDIADDEAGEEVVKAPDDAANEDDITKRKLCADGACVGVIGANGKCKVCGKTADGSQSAEDDEDEYEDDADDAEDAEDAEDGEDDADHAVEKVTDGKQADDAKTAKTADDDERALCPDGSCVGLIGDNGKCKVCGKAAG